MEGVGARSGRTSTRHGTTSAVFIGPVRKWKKKWVHVAPPKHHHTTNNSNHHSNNHNNNHHNNSNGIIISNNNNSNTSTGTTTGSNGPSNLLFFKWAPVHNASNGDIIINNDNSSNNRDGDDDHQGNDAVQPAPRRKFRYIPVALLEEQQNEAAENEAEEKSEDEVKLNDANSDAVEPTSKIEVLVEKPDINDVPMEENQDADEAPSARQDLNKNLSFNLNSNDDDPESDTNVDED